MVIFHSYVELPEGIPKSNIPMMMFDDLWDDWANIWVSKITFQTLSLFWIIHPSQQLWRAWEGSGCWQWSKKVCLRRPSCRFAVGRWISSTYWRFPYMILLGSWNWQTYCKAMTFVFQGIQSTFCWRYSLLRIENRDEHVRSGWYDDFQKTSQLPTQLFGLQLQSSAGYSPLNMNSRYTYTEQAGLVRPLADSRRCRLRLKSPSWQRCALIVQRIDEAEWCHWTSQQVLASSGSPGLMFWPFSAFPNY